MPLLVLTYAAADLPDAQSLRSQLLQAGFEVLLVGEHPQQDAPEATPFDRAIERAQAVCVLISPHTAASSQVLQVIHLARQRDRLILPLMVHPTDPLPWFVNEFTIIDLTAQPDQMLYRHVIQRLATSAPTMTFGAARDAFVNRASLKSRHTLDAYDRAISLFLAFLDDRHQRLLLPLQRLMATTAADTELNALSEGDVPIFLHFVQWLMAPSSSAPGDRRPYKPSTVELRLSGVLNWFQFMDDYGWLPGAFKLAKARRMVLDELHARPGRSGPPRPPDHIEEIITFYDSQQPPKPLLKPGVDPDRLRVWELTRLRNRALVHSLAETGGRISEVLSLDVSDFPVRALHSDDVWRVEVRGKGGHTYYLRFYAALPALRAYIEARGADLRASAKGRIPLFVSHAPRFEGQRMNRVVAWRVVQRAAHALGLGNITPHDFRHWRATQLINAGYSLDVVQDYLGHRSVETTRAYYAHTDPLRVDAAARTMLLPKAAPGT